MTISRDPKGYYIVLGIAEDADVIVIKSAFRSRAKRLHPDFNPSPIAAKQFNRLHEAYATLSDPKKRNAYDRPWKNEAKSSPRSADTPPPSDAGTARQTAEPQTPPPRPAASTTTSTPEPPRAKATESETPVSCRCGQVTAQPRFVIFDMVWGRLGRVHRRSLAGVYCRKCADRTAIRASLVSWLAGWWAWPDGPRETIRALLTNFHGGRKPPDRNARLLMRQARAFRTRGDMDLARSAAEQARQYARSPTLVREIDTLRAALGPGSGRVLKDRWAQAGWGAMVQVLPLALAVGLLAGIVTFFLPRPKHGHHVPAPTVVLRESHPVPSAPPTAGRQSYAVALEKATVHAGPAETSPVLAILKRGAIVMALSVDARGDWLRATLPDGGTGFIALNELQPASQPDHDSAAKPARSPQP